MAESYLLRSRILDEDRRLNVYTPRNYESSDQLYPVVYVLDGELLFNLVAAVVDYYTNTYRIPSMLVVGIESTDRTRDFTPNPLNTQPEQPPTGGGADRFLCFMKEELFPYVEEHYRVRKYRAIVGHSLAGLFVLHVLLSEPEMFDAYVALSPYLAWDNGSMVRRAETMFNKALFMDKLLFIANEAPLKGRQNSHMDDLTQLLRSRCPNRLEWDYKLYEGADHMNLPVHGIPDGLEFLFPGFVQQR